MKLERGECGTAEDNIGVRAKKTSGIYATRWKDFLNEELSIKWQILPTSNPNPDLI